MKKYLPIAIVVFLITGLTYLGLFLATKTLVEGQKRLEEDIVIVQNTQFDLLQQLSSKSGTAATSSALKVKFNTSNVGIR